MKLEESDVRRMVRLIGEVAAVRGGHAEKKHFLMEGLCRLIGADAWAWALSCQRQPDQPQVYVSLLKEGFTERTFAKLLEAVEHPQQMEITAPFFQEVQEKKTHVTRHRNQIFDPKRYVGTSNETAWKAADIGPVIMSLRPLDSSSASAIAIYRRYGREEFDDRDSLIAHIILSEVPWLHEQGWPEDRGVSVPKLSRRLRLVMNLLTVGRSRKQIADELGISLNTAQGYVKDVYRHFKINSQAELMSRFFQGKQKDI